MFHNFHFLQTDMVFRIPFHEYLMPFPAQVV